MYHETDLFALASFAEGVPVVLMEAMSMNIPCRDLDYRSSGTDPPWRGWLVGSSLRSYSAGRSYRLPDGSSRAARTTGHKRRKRVEERYHLAKNTGLLAQIFRRRLSS